MIGLDNGVARTPPMGFISWQRFESETDCAHHPTTCISETLYLEIAKAMKDTGLTAAGYVYVNIDDNWSKRSSNVEADPDRFPNGMGSLSSRIQALGMKLGMYSDIGTKTCQGYKALNMDDPSQRDSDIAFIDQLIEWRVEYLKVDGCNSQISHFRETYPKLSELIQDRLKVKNEQRAEDIAEFKPILLSCSWPAYQQDHGVNEEDLALLRKYCNTWRNQGDIRDSWGVVRALVDWYASRSKNSDDLLVSAAGPGHWNDPDMLVIGNNGLNIEQERTQFNLWAIMAAPLYISADVRTMKEKRPESLAVLLNKKVIAVNQDELGRQGWVIDVVEGYIRVWMRPLSPGTDENERVAVLFESLREEGYMYDYTLGLEKLGWSGFTSWTAEDCYSDKVIRGSDPVFPVSLDENTSQMYVFTKIGGTRSDYPTHEFVIKDKADSMIRRLFRNWMSPQHLAP